jgi:hypothetical protein
LARSAPALTTALLAIAVYSNITRNEPALDDGWVIFDNPSIRHLELLVKRLGPAAGERLVGRCEGLAVLWVAGLFVLTWQRNLDWESPLSLWTAEYQRAPEDPTVNVSLASASDARGDFQAGRAWAEQAIRLSPGNWAAQVASTRGERSWGVVCWRSWGASSRASPSH